MISNKKGFIATSVLYTLVALLAMILLVIINNYASVVKVNRVESEYIKEKIYDSDSDIIFAWKYDGTKDKPSIFPNKGEGYHISNIECSGGVGSFNSYTWKAEVRMTANKARCDLTVSDGDITTASLNATSADLLTTKSCLVVNNNGDLVLVNGSMANNGAITKNLTTSGESYTIPKGYHNGSGIVTAPTLASLVGSNVNLESGENLLTGYTAYGKDGKKITGSMANRGAVTQTLNAGGSYTIPKGYHNGSGKITVSSLASQTPATATASQILSGQTAWVNGSKVTGTMANKGTLNWKPTNATTYTIPAGYYSGGTLDSTAAYNQGVKDATQEIVYVSQYLTTIGHMCKPGEGKIDEKYTIQTPKYTIPTDGRYIFVASGMLTFQDHSTQSVTHIYRNDVDVPVAKQDAWTVNYSGGGAYAHSKIVDCKKGDIIYAAVWDNLGYDYRHLYMSIYRVG